MSDEATRRAVLTEAKLWLDTPYQHQASMRGAGTDCLGLIRGIWRALYEDEPEAPPAYTPDWGDDNGEEQLLLAAQKWLIPIENPIKKTLKKSSVQPGDVLLFRMLPDAPCKHIGILSAPDRLLHAYWGKAVVESFFVPYWQRRWCYSFAFPSLTQEHNS